jgi:hypothetical protein
MLTQDSVPMNQYMAWSMDAAGRRSIAINPDSTGGSATADPASNSNSRTGARAFANARPSNTRSRGFTGARPQGRLSRLLDRLAAGQDW